MRPKASQAPQLNYFSSFRLNLWYGVILLVFALFLVRLFYLQVIQHDRYSLAAYQGQYKEYEVPAARGVIEAHDGNNIVPIVLNEEVFTLFADPKYVKDPHAAADAIARIIGGNASEYEEKMKTDTHYAVLAKKLPQDKSDALNKLEIKGVGTRVAPQRTYPQGTLAAQLLGFVNDEGEGKYGVEQYLDEQLKGKPGELKAITDASGVPLVGAGDNVRRDPEQGKRTLLTIDLSMQRRLEDTLKAHLEQVRSKSGSVIVMDPATGAIKAMANYPTYNPADFAKVEDASVFNNSAASSPMEPGSIMKTLTVAAGLNEGVINANTTYYDPSFYKIGTATVRNVEEDGGAATRSIADILRYSLNTGATYVLMQLGGGQLNEQGRLTWNRYLTNNYHFGQKTGIEQGYEAEGFVPSPTEGYGLDIQYANTAFGQGINVTPLQIASAFSATVNGGIYYRPHLVEPADSSKKDIIKTDTVKPEVSEVLRGMHENSVQNNYRFLKRDGYRVGGKTGTAEVPKPNGGYYDDRYNGTFLGYVGGDTPQYVIMVRVDEPKVAGYAGTSAAAPLFAKTMDMLIQNYAVSQVSR
ncbi:MAG: peptidoglycan D,D-transpeptidase FtsI family protein [Candidatus Saccharimonadales bacterium]